ncbi:MAG: hypothetical protein LBL21_04725 [Rickettsiales bacterium]|jgi:hypothetical protein|nr:hypothetical protein [Rickettsiales bacterium]
MKYKVLTSDQKRKILRDWQAGVRQRIDDAFGAKIDSLGLADTGKDALRLDIQRFLNTASLYISGLEQRILHPMNHQAQTADEKRADLIRGLGGADMLREFGVKVSNYEKGETGRIDIYADGIINAILDGENPARNMAEYAKITYHNATMHNERLSRYMKEGLKLRAENKIKFPAGFDDGPTIWVELDTPILPEEAQSYNLFKEILGPVPDAKIEQTQNEKGIFYLNYQFPDADAATNVKPRTEKLKTVIDAVAMFSKTAKSDEVIAANGITFDDPELLGALVFDDGHPAALFGKLGAIQAKRGKNKGKGEKHYKNQFLVSSLRKNPLLAMHLAIEMRNLGLGAGADPETALRIFRSALEDLEGKYAPYGDYLEKASGFAGRGFMESVDMLAFSIAPWAVATQSTYQDWENCMHALAVNNVKIPGDIGFGVVACYGRNKARPTHNIFNMATYQLRDDRGDAIYRTSDSFYGKSFKGLHETVSSAFNSVFGIDETDKYGLYEIDRESRDFLYVEGIKGKVVVVNTPDDYKRAMLEDRIIPTDRFWATLRGGGAESEGKLLSENPDLAPDIIKVLDKSGGLDYISEIFKTLESDIPDHIVNLLGGILQKRAEFGDLRMQSLLSALAIEKIRAFTGGIPNLISREIKSGYLDLTEIDTILAFRFSRPEENMDFIDRNADALIDNVERLAKKDAREVDSYILRFMEKYWDFFKGRESVLTGQIVMKMRNGVDDQYDVCGLIHLPSERLEFLADHPGMFSDAMKKLYRDASGINIYIAVDISSSKIPEIRAARDTMSHYIIREVPVLDEKGAEFVFANLHNLANIGNIAGPLSSRLADLGRRGNMDLVEILLSPNMPRLGEHGKIVADRIARSIKENDYFNPWSLPEILQSAAKPARDFVDAHHEIIAGYLSLPGLRYNDSATDVRLLAGARYPDIEAAAAGRLLDILKESKGAPDIDYVIEIMKSGDPKVKRFAAENEDILVRNVKKSASRKNGTLIEDAAWLLSALPPDEVTRAAAAIINIGMKNGEAAYKDLAAVLDVKKDIESAGVDPDLLAGALRRRIHDELKNPSPDKYGDHFLFVSPEDGRVSLRDHMSEEVKESIAKYYARIFLRGENDEADDYVITELKRGNKFRAAVIGEFNKNPSDEGFKKLTEVAERFDVGMINLITDDKYALRAAKEMFGSEENPYYNSYNYSKIESEFVRRDKELIKSAIAGTKGYVYGAVKDVIDAIPKDIRLKYGIVGNAEYIKDTAKYRAMIIKLLLSKNPKQKDLDYFGENAENVIEARKEIRGKLKRGVEKIKSKINPFRPRPPREME